VLNQPCTGYVELPGFPQLPPDPNVRAQPVSNANQAMEGSSKGHSPVTPASTPNRAEEKFYSDDEEEVEEEEEEKEESEEKSEAEGSDGE